MQSDEDPLIAKIHASIMSPITDGWRVKTIDKVTEVAVYSRENPDKSVHFDQFLAVVKLPISMSDAAELIHVAANRRKWDKNVVEISEDLKTNLLYFTTAPALMRTISARDFVDRRLFRITDDLHLCAVESQKLEQYPIRKGFVRGWTYGNGVAITPAGKNSCVVRMLGCSDAGGWLPKKAVELGIPSVMASILDSMLKEARAA